MGDKAAVEVRVLEGKQVLGEVPALARVVFTEPGYQNLGVFSTVDENEVRRKHRRGNSALDKRVN